MKYMLVSALLFSSSHAFAYTFSEQGCSKAQIQAAQKEVEIVKDRFGVGEVTRTDVEMAEMKVLETMYCSEAPAPVSVSCIDLTSRQQLILDLFKEELRIGARTFQDYGLELTKAGALFMFCYSNK